MGNFQDNRNQFFAEELNASAGETDEYNYYLDWFGLSSSGDSINTLSMDFLYDLGIELGHYNDMWCQFEGALPTPADLIQYTNTNYEGSDGYWYQQDKKGDQLRTVHKGGVGVFNDSDNDTNCGNICESTVFDITLYSTLESTGTFFSKGTAAGTDTNYCADISGTDLRFFGYTSGTYMATYAAESIAGYDLAKEYKLRFVADTVGVNSRFTIYIDDVLFVTHTSTHGYIGVTTSDFLIGSRFETNYAGVPMSSFVISIDGVEEAEYDFEEQTGTVLLDKSGNDNHGTINGDLTSFWDTDIGVESPKNENGYNASLKFDGVNDYIDTGIAPNTNTIIELDFMAHTPTSNDGIFGTYDSSDFIDRCMFYMDGISNFTVLSPSGAIVTLISGGAAHKATLNTSDDSFIFDGVTYTGSASFATLNTTKTIKIAGGIDGVSASGIVVYSAKIWKDDVLVRDMIPTTDGVMVDKLTGTTYTNQGAGDLTVGYVPRLETTANLAVPVTSQTDIFDNELQYYGRARLDSKITKSSTLTTNGTDNYIDTGIIPDENTKIIIEGNFTSAAKNFDAFGEEDFVDTSRSFYMRRQSNGIMHGRLGTVSASGSRVVGSEKINIEFTKQGLYLDGELEIDYSAGTLTQPIKNFILSNVTIPADSSKMAAFKYSEVKMYQSDVLVRHYVFGEGSGTVVYDKVTGERYTINGTLTDVWTTSDEQRPNNLLDGFNTSNTFDGVANKVDLETELTGVFAATDTKTVLTRFKLNADATNTYKSQIICVVPYMYMQVRDASNAINIRYDMGSAVVKTYTLGTGDRGWHTVVGTYVKDTTNRLKLWVDNSYKGESTNANDPVTTYASEWGLGERNSGFCTHTISETLILDREPTTQEIAEWETGDLDVSAISDDVKAYLIPVVKGTVVEGAIAEKNGYYDSVTSKMHYAEGSEFENVYIPSSESDEDYDVLGNKIYYKGTTRGHNGSENLIVQPDAPELYAVPLSLESDGVGDYIDTGVTDNVNLSIEVQGSILTLADIVMIGLRDSQDFYIGTSAANKWRFGYGTDGATDIGASDTSVHTLKLDKDGICYIDGIQVADKGSSPRTSMSRTVYLYARNFGGTANKFVNYNLNYSKIWADDELVRWYVPIKKGDTMGTKTATANGLYDKINDTVTYNSGTGDMPIYNGLMTYGYDDMEADKNDVHYWFNDVLSKSPIKFNSLMYNKQQTGANLAKALRFTKSYIIKYDPSTYFEAVSLYK